MSLSIAANTGSGSRTGTLTIAGQTVTVTQQGVSCTTTISPTSVTAPDTLTNGTVNVTSGAGCAWTAASNAPWMTIDSGATGTGPGAVTYTIAANTGTAGRTGSMTIGGQTFNVTQNGRSCLATFNPSSTSVAAAWRQSHGGCDDRSRLQLDRQHLPAVDFHYIWWNGHRSRHDRL